MQAATALRRLIAMQPIPQLSALEQLNFLLTNRIPRNFATRCMGWYSRLQSRRLTRFSIAVWQLFADDLNLGEARESEFRSLQECFTRELREGARPVDARADSVCSPCDAEVGAMGRIEGGRVYQAKGFPYELQDLIPDTAVRERYRDGLFITLRLKSSMYHRFHAPLDCELREVNYIRGDTWNVNPVALRRVEKLFCKNERVVLDLQAASGPLGICLVPVAAILVASIRLHCLRDPLDLSYRGPRRIACDAVYAKGQQMGYFQHGSTIVLFARRGYAFQPGIDSGKRIFAGQALLQAPPATDPEPGNRRLLQEMH